MGQATCVVEAAQSVMSIRVTLRRDCVKLMISSGHNRSGHGARVVLASEEMRAIAAYSPPNEAINASTSC